MIIKELVTTLSKDGLDIIELHVEYAGRSMLFFHTCAHSESMLRTFFAGSGVRLRIFDRADLTFHREGIL